MVTELFIRERKLSISLVFLTQFYFAVSKNSILSSLHYFFYKNFKQKATSINCI